MSELIDRKDVIDRLKKAEDVFRQNGAKLEANGIHYALELVESDIEIPTVEYTFEEAFKKTVCEQQLYCPNKRQTGHWIKDEQGIDRCSKCFHRCMEFVLGKPSDKFCIECGAKMGGEEE